jgi:hypothetical protein
MVGILKNAPEPKVPRDFFDLGNHATVEEVNRTQKAVMEDEVVEDNKDSEPSRQSTKTVASCQEEALPEGFFDDPLLDAKVRYTVLTCEQSPINIRIIMYCSVIF